MSHHIVISLLPDRRFTVDYLSGDPRKTLERWARNSDSRLPVAAFPYERGVYDFLQNAELVFPGELIPTDRIPVTGNAGWIRRCPLVSEWRGPVQRYAAQYEGAAVLLAGLAER